ncbi:zona pellucida sperm-binding protein 4-like [Protopterus annectens]|uniref:zona pellucida sperm-binding protein 4-like n=1 Tax=Protopterus annectens TaxID=7888 RepID=UPI001CF9670E|nr:zona pellucida sperm-binding protein 4-like [Protopterus annectens]
MMVCFRDLLMEWVFVLWVVLPTVVLAHFNVSYSCLPNHVKINFKNIAGWKLNILNHTDTVIPLSNASKCGLTTHMKNPSWLVVFVEYDSCYIYEKVPQGITLVFEALLLSDLNKRNKVTVECKEKHLKVGDATALRRLANADMTTVQRRRLGCWMPANLRVACDLSAPTEMECLQVGCCFDSLNPEMPCYYGNTGCSDDGFFIIVIQKEVTKPALDLSSVTLAGAPQCNPVYFSADIIIYRFPLSGCAAVTKVDGSDVIYEANVQATRNIQVGPRGTITRDSQFGMTVMCRYNKTKHLDLQVSVFTVAPPLPATNVGPLQLELRIATDVHYRAWYSEKDYPIHKILREPVYAEVRILGRTDPSIELVLDACWATPSVNPNDVTSWNLLVTRCPFDGDNYKTILHEVDRSSGLEFPTHHKRFEIKTFVFLDSSTAPLSEMVYLHCSAAICHPSKESCRSNCQQRLKRNVVSMTSENEEALVSSGPLIFKRLEQIPELLPTQPQVENLKLPGDDPAEMGGSIGLLTTSAVLVVASAFGVGLCILAGATFASKRKFCKKDAN